MGKTIDAIRCAAIPGVQPIIVLTENQAMELVAEIDKIQAEAAQMQERLEAQNSPIIMPLGWLAGKSITVAEAIQGLSAEINGHAADLEHAAGANPRNDQADAFWYKKQADTLRRYGAAAWLIHWQTLTPAQKAQSKIDPAGMLELVEKHRLTLPSDLAQLGKEENEP